MLRKSVLAPDPIAIGSWLFNQRKNNNLIFKIPLSIAIQDKLKILIIDDEKQFTEELSGFFLSSGFESFQANTVGDGEKI